MVAKLMSRKEREWLEVLGWKERSGISLVMAAEVTGGKLSTGEEDLGAVQDEEEYGNCGRVHILKV
jgi:hypothetical protein